MGPFSPTEIYAMLDRGEITDSDFAWTDGLPGWQPLSSLLPPAAQPAAPPPAAPPSDNRARIIFPAVIRYAVGIALCVVAIIAQEAHRTYSAPVRVSPDTAGLIGALPLSPVTFQLRLSGTNTSKAGMAVSWV